MDASCFQEYCMWKFSFSWSNPTLEWLSYVMGVKMSCCCAITGLRLVYEKWPWGMVPIPFELSVPSAGSQCHKCAVNHPCNILCWSSAGAESAQAYTEPMPSGRWGTATDRSG